VNGSSSTLNAPTCNGWRNQEREMESREQTESQAESLAERKVEQTEILEEIEIEDLTVDGICGVY
jgi:mycofactocin precursor